MYFGNLVHLVGKTLNQKRNFKVEAKLTSFFQIWRGVQILEGAVQKWYRCIYKIYALHIVIDTCVYIYLQLKINVERVK